MWFLIFLSLFVHYRRKHRRIRGTPCSFGSPNSSTRCVVKVSVALQAAPVIFISLLTLPQKRSRLKRSLTGNNQGTIENFHNRFCFFSLRTRPVLHWHGQFSAKSPVPCDGDGPAWTISRRPVPVLQEKLWSQDRLDDCGATHSTHREGAWWAHHS